MPQPPDAGLTLDLSVVERLVLFGALPKEGSFDTLRLIRRLQEDLALSEEEQRAVNYRFDEKESKAYWDRNVSKTITFTPGAVELLRKVLDEISAKGQAQGLHLALYERLGAPEGD